MGITQEDYDESPPFVTDALVDAWTDKQERENRRVALLAWASCTKVKEDGKSFAVDDFMPKPPMSAELREELLQAKLATLAAHQAALLARQENPTNVP